jgi:hypothetical protein
MGKKTKKRRQSDGLWKWTDCWYYTRPGTRKRVALFDENGARFRGKETKKRRRSRSLASSLSGSRIAQVLWAEESGLLHELCAAFAAHGLTVNPRQQ